MGHAYLQDVIGMDTLLHVLHRISEGFPDRLRISFPHAAELLVQQRRLGQKNATGFYRYNRDSKGRHRKEVDPETTPLLARAQPGGLRCFEDDELLERLILRMIIEAVRCLEGGHRRNCRRGGHERIVALVKRIPQRRLGQPGDLDGALLLLASDASRYMTGSIITIDGGHLVNTL
jgi:hypothetical protein